MAWLRDNQNGATMVEYALLVGLIVTVLAVAVTSFGGSVRDSFSESASRIEEASSS